MDAHAKTTSHIGYMAIMVDAGEEAKAVDDKDFGILHISFCSILISYNLATSQEFLYLRKMILANHMRSDDEFPIFVFIKVLDEDFLIRGPRGTCDKDMGRIFREGFNHRQLLGSLLDLEHTIEARIAHNRNIVDSNLSQQFFTYFILHKEMGEAIQHWSVLTSIPLEEHLIRAEDAGHAIDGHMTMLQDVQVVVPELVLDEKCHHRTNGPQETTGIGNGIEWQIGDDICAFVVFTYLIARG